MFVLWSVFCFIRAATSDWVEIPQSSKYQRNLVNPPLTSTESTTTKFDNETYFEDDQVDDNLQDSTLSFLPFIEMVQGSLLQTENKSIKKKTLFLKHLRDDLLINIEKRMRTLWLKPHEAGEAREYKEEHYHMDFPSNEGALMTIGFLTFAVFLIKLVLKLIHALKAKYNNYNDNQDSDTTTTTYFGRRKKRAMEEANKILQLIEEYNSYR